MDKEDILRGLGRLNEWLKGDPMPGETQHGKINLRDLHRQEAEREGRDPTVKPESLRTPVDGIASPKWAEADEWWDAPEQRELHRSNDTEH